MIHYTYVKYIDSVTKAVVIKAISSYAGKTVCGVAKCNAADNFSEADGRKLARLRCDAKIAKKRLHDTAVRLAAARQAVAEARNQCNKCEHEYDTNFNIYYNIYDEMTTLKLRLNKS